jgi:hypothetical protein
MKMWLGEALNIHIFRNLSGLSNQRGQGNEAYTAQNDKPQVIHKQRFIWLTFTYGDPCY